jgi:hypothetical protein
MSAATCVWGTGSARSVLQSIAGRPFFSLSTLLGVALVGSLPFPAVGAPINYGSHVGLSVNYIDVTEDTTTGDSLPLFGAPVFSGNSVDFNPVGFDADASGANSSDVTGARLTFMVQAHAGNAINNIAFSEAGDTTLAGAGTDATATQVTANGTITINAVDGAAISPIVRPIALAFTPSGGDYGLSSDGGGLPIFHTQWSGSLAVNVAQILTSEGMAFILGATKISVDVVNTLTASSELGTQALINKEDFGGVSITVNQPGGGDPGIPEPASAILLGAGILGLAASGGRKARRHLNLNHSA